ncbi:enoyl-CoA hydratase [Rhodobacterales bacterium HKCCE2091]|nr:enoyl-CoA hydratase [Rhodobacterales bacterium HKCCE2091]
MTSPEPEGRVRGEAEGRTGWIVFDNPARLNALSEAMSAEALGHVTAFAADDDIRVLILRGAGTRAFILGGDISKFGDRTGDPGQDRQHFEALKRALAETDKPVVAMIHGYCLGGGLGLALAADIRLAASSARLGIPAVRRALGYPLDHLVTLVSIVGPAAAKDLMLSGRQVEADEALRMGLVSRVIPTEALERETRAYAETLSGNAPLTMRAAKHGIDALMRPTEERDMARLQRMVDAATDSEDHREAIRAFMEKRRPVFRGR